MKRFHLVLALCLAAIVGLKGFYAWGVLEPHSRVFASLLDEAAFSAVAFWLAFGIERLSRRWVRALLKGALMLGVVAVAVLYFLIVGTYAVVGSFPRWQWLSGLTWKTIGPSFVPMLMQNKVPITVGLVAAALFALGLCKARLPRWRANWRGALVLTLLVAGAEAASTPALGKVVHVRERQLLGRAFQSDLEAGGAPGDLAQELEFFQAHDARLKSAFGREPLYAELFETLRGQNIVLLALESVRAKDLPPYGGKATMPFLSSMADHCITLDRLYGQDTRSTKTYGAFELGVYELISWESYSHGLSTRFTEDSVAWKLKQLGYATHSLANGDPSYDNNGLFSKARGYDDVLYQPDINPGTSDSDDLKMLERIKELLARNDHRPGYFFVWPFATHHPYGREYWADIEGWKARHPEGIQHRGKEDHERYLASLTEADDFLRRLTELFAAAGRANTTYFLVGDHGEAFGEHEANNAFHGNNVYEESMRVAGLVCSPSITHGARDGRLFMIKDIAPSILELAGAPEPYLGNGRSIFERYAQPMPAFFFNSFTRTAGIIDDGWKYRTLVDQPEQRFFASLDEIAADPNAESKPAGDDPRTAHAQDELQAWLRAMSTRTRRLLSGASQSLDNLKLQDWFRVYCDDGTGFVEALHGSTAYKTNGDDAIQLEIPMHHACTRLRLAPFRDTVLPSNVSLKVVIERLERYGDDGSPQSGPAPAFTEVLNGEPTGPGTYLGLGGPFTSQLCIDYALGTSPEPVAKVTIRFRVQAKRLSGSSP